MRQAFTPIVPINERNSVYAMLYNIMTINRYHRGPYNNHQDKLTRPHRRSTICLQILSEDIQSLNPWSVADILCTRSTTVLLFYVVRARSGIYFLTIITNAQSKWCPHYNLSVLINVIGLFRRIRRIRTRRSFEGFCFWTVLTRIITIRRYGILERKRIGKLALLDLFSLF